MVTIEGIGCQVQTVCDRQLGAVEFAQPYAQGREDRVQDS